MDNNRKTIRYITKEDGFKYHTRKCVMIKGSTITKNIYPDYEVEILKKKLLETGKIIEKRSHYVCKRNVQTGVLTLLSSSQAFMTEFLLDDKIIYTVYMQY